MNQDEIIKVISPKVISETIENETIIINLDSGEYYSLNDVAGKIWNLIDNRSSISRTLEKSLQMFQGDREQICNAVEEFLNLLKENNLISFHQFSSQERADHSNDNSEAPNAPFEMPKLEKYTDMQDLLLLDPIHDVEETGWPLAKVK